MNYDLTVKEERAKFLRYANSLMKNKRNNVSLVDESNRTLSQNSYIHVLCRILAQDTGTSVEYAKQVYFKELANPDIFVHVTKDPITNQVQKFIRSTCELKVPEMSQAIDNFILWAADNGYELPAASLDEDGNMAFRSDKDRQAYHQAVIETSKEQSRV